MASGVCMLCGGPRQDPLAGWMEQKLPSAAWEYPMASPPEIDLPPLGPAAEADSGIPDDLQDLFLDSPAVDVPALPGDDANTLLEDLISGSVRENPELYGGLSPSDGGSPLDGDELQACSPAALAAGAELLAPPGFGVGVSPGPPRQVSLEPWAPGEPPSPPCAADGGAAPAAGPDWSPACGSPPTRRRQARPRPYDKPVRRQQLSEEERRQRKKEQNKNAATRYRQKKKEEHDLISCDQDMLETRNKELRDRVSSLTKELTYLKELMREVLRHKRAV